MSEYDRKKVCEYYIRDTGHCAFFAKHQADNLLPPLAKVTQIRGEIRYICSARLNPTGSLSVEAVEKQEKQCEPAYSPRGHSGHVSGMRSRMGR